MPGGYVMEPLISVIVPIYNAEQYLDRCIKSILSQTYADLEVILIDDGSSDSSSNICKQYELLDRRVRYYYQKNSGVSAARNKGLDIAKGEYIGFCDADDWIETDMYEVLYSMINSTQSDVSICSFAVDTDQAQGELHDDSRILLFSARDAIIEMNRGVLFAGHLCNKLFRRSVVSGIRLSLDIAIYEDMCFLSEVFVKCNQVAFRNVSKYHYVQLQTSALHVYKECFWSIQQACRLMYDRMKRDFPDDIEWAQKTALLGNISLALRISDTGRMKLESYKKIRQEIEKYATPKAINHLPIGYRRALSMFRKGWIVFEIYTLIRCMKHFIHIERA